MTRAVIYARYSSDRQNERSIEDQVVLCQSYAATKGYSVLRIFEDRARSGASLIGRDALLELMGEAARGAFDMIIVESLDRLSRDQEDCAGLYKRLRFNDVEIAAVHGGVADQVQIGVRGLVNALYLEDLAHKTRRGLAGMIRSGRSAGGRAFGYRPVPGKPGELKIVDEEADVIRRIFAEYASGRPPREIAGDLNREGIPAPRGPRWNASTINGNSQRGAGIIFNQMYVGKIVWNKVRMVKNPDTGRRISRANPPNELHVVEVPHLRIVDQQTWDRVHELKAEKAKLHNAHKRRPSHLLSGLLRCGVCGSGMSVHDTDKQGRKRVRCSAFRESGSCSNRRSVYTDKIEEAVLSSLGEHLKDIRLIEHYVRTYNQERAQLARDSSGRRLKIERRLAAIQSEKTRLVKAIAKGMIGDEEAATEMQALRQEANAIETELIAIEAPANVISLHPAAVAHYLASVRELRDSIRGHIEAGNDRSAVATELRSLVHSVVVTPDVDGKGFEINVQGKLANLTGSHAFELGGKVVAGEGLEPPTRGL